MPERGTYNDLFLLNLAYRVYCFANYMIIQKKKHPKTKQCRSVFAHKTGGFKSDRQIREPGLEKIMIFSPPFLPLVYSICTSKRAAVFCMLLIQVRQVSMHVCSLKMWAEKTGLWSDGAAKV